MFDFGAAVISGVGALALQSAYFAVLKYPVELKKKIAGHARNQRITSLDLVRWRKGIDEAEKANTLIAALLGTVEEYGVNAFGPQERASFEEKARASLAFFNGSRDDSSNNHLRYVQEDIRSTLEWCRTL